MSVVLCVATHGFAGLWGFCIASQREYCARHGHEYRLIESPVAGLNGKWSKLAAAREALAEGRDLMLLDADIEIAAETPPFTALLERGGEAILVAPGRSGRPNSGVMVFRGAAAETGLAFLDACLAAREVPVPEEDAVTATGENGHVIHLLRQPAFAAATGALEEGWNCADPATAESAFLRHYTGRLRRDLLSGAVPERLTGPFPEPGPEGLRLRAAFLHHELARPGLRARLDGDPALLETLRDRVRAAAGALALPRLLSDDANHWLWNHGFVAGLLERPTVEFVERALAGRREAAVIDGGAHVGYVSRAALVAAGQGARLLAVEAHPDNLAALQANLSSAPGAILAAAALTGREGPVRLQDGRGHSNSSLHAGGPSTGREIEVPGRTIDGLTAEHGIGRIDLLKLDIEGGEVEALLGARETLARSPEAVVVVESNPKLLKLAGRGPQDLVRLMHRLGFAGRELRDDFRFGPVGVLPAARTVNIAFARPGRWRDLAPRPPRR